jgi:hypothetical protein
MTDIQFQANLSLVLAHTLLLEVKGREPIGVAWILNTSPFDPFNIMAQDPKVPAFKPVNTQREQAAAIAGNVANFSDISKLAGETNAFNQTQLNQMLEQGSPGYAALMGGIRDKASSFLSGEIPQDVQDQIGRNAAYKSLSGGYSGSGMARNLVARDLGLTSLDIIGKGIDAGTRWAATARAATADQFNPASMFITPEQRIQTKMFNTAGSFQRDWMKSQVDSQSGFWGHTAQGGADMSKL